MSAVIITRDCDRFSCAPVIRRERERERERELHWNSRTIDYSIGDRCFQILDGNFRFVISFAWNSYYVNYFS